MSIHDDLENAHREKNYDKLCSIYDQHSDICEIQPSEWDFTYLMNGLYKNKRYADCLTLYKTCKKVYPACDLLNDKMGGAYITSFSRHLISLNNPVLFFLKKSTMY